MVNLDWFSNDCWKIGSIIRRSTLRFPARAWVMRELVAAGIPIFKRRKRYRLRVTARPQHRNPAGADFVIEENPRRNRTAFPPPRGPRAVPYGLFTRHQDCRTYRVMLQRIIEI